MDALKKEFNLNNYDLNLIYSYLQLSSEKRAAIREFFQNIAANETIDQIKKNSIHRKPCIFTCTAVNNRSGKDYHFFRFLPFFKEIK